MSETVFHRYRLKRRTTAGWASNNEVLLAGEPGIEVLADGSEKFKYGDGVKTWSQLGYAQGSGSPPAAHKASHATGGADALTPGDIGAATAAQGAKADSAVQPTGLTKAAVGLGNVENTSDADKPISTATANALAGKVDTGDSRLSDSRTPTAHSASHATGAPDALLPGDIGAAPAVHEHAIGSISGLQAALDGKATSAQGDLAQSAVQPAELTTALAGKADLIGGLVPAAQLPGFVDDVLEYANFAAFPQPGETGKQYLDIDQRKIYRWSGTVYQEISPSPGSTDAVPEGLVNLYFTLARSRNAISGAGLITYDPLTGTIGFSGTLFNPAAPGAIGGTTAGAATFTRLGSKRQVVTAAGSPLTITLDCSAFNEFVAAASVTANTIINITGLNTIPSDEVVRYVFRFTWASGAITLSAPAGYTFKRAGSTPGSAGDYQLLITAAGDSTVLLVSYGGAHT